MKKTYSKPEFIFESFQLSANIATGCTLITKLQAEGQCGYNDGVKVIFTTEISGCVTQPTEGDTMCYHVPNDVNNLFTS